jgi:hypothetical protein
MLDLGGKLSAQVERKVDFPTRDSDIDSGGKPEVL